MRPLILALALLVGGAAHGQQPPAPAPAEAPAPEAPAADPPAEAPAPVEATAATVLRHEVLVVVDGGKRARTTRTWEVRIDDPAACTAGLIAPAGFDGASDGGATVLEDTLLVPEGTPAGTVFTLEAEVTSPHKGGHSGGFLTAPDLPTERARFEVRAASWLPLHVWHDAHGTPDIGTRGGRSVTVEWTDLAPGSEAEAVWSTFEDWIQAGTEIAGIVDDRLADKQGLGREMASGYTGLHLGEAAERVGYTLQLDPNGPTDWKLARPAEEVIRDGKGSPVDHGVVLLSLLRLANYEAEPGYYRPAGARGNFPIAVPAPALLGRPLIVVHREQGDVFIDPGNPYVSVPDMPAALIGGTTWVPGDLPTPQAAEQTADGSIRINANLVIDADGSSQWTADFTAEGTALQWLRERLAPLDPDARTEALRRLVSVGRPEPVQFGATTTGLEKVRSPLKISVTGHDASLLGPMGSGLMGEVPALLAPALAAWLPPNIVVRESLAIQVPRSVEIVAAAPPDSAFSDVALLSRTTDRTGARVALITEVLRPSRMNTSAMEVGARDFLEAEAARGPVLVVHAAASKESIEQLRASSLDPVDKLVLEAVLWWKQRTLGKASRSLRFALLEHGGEATATSLRRYAPDQKRLWRSLAETTTKHGTLADRLAVLTATGEVGYWDLAWAAAVELASDEELDADSRASALLLSLDVQPEAAPDAERNPEGHARWIEPGALLDQAEALAGADDPRIVLRRAHIAADAEDWEAVASLLTKLSGTDRTPAVEALAARAMSENGASVAEVLAQLDKALATAPYDPEVLVSAAAIAHTVGETRKAAAMALSAARIQATDPRRWDMVATLQMAAGDLPTAGMAARRASDLRPKGKKRANTLALVSALLHDEAGWELARSRNPEALKALTFPPAMDQLMEIAPSDALLGVLQHHDAVVLADPALLGIRAQMRLDAGLLDAAARDGVLLDARHKQADGVALAYTANAGRMYSTTWGKRLDTAAKDSLAARATRMEVGLVLGTSDPTADSGPLAGDPRADLIARLRSDPTGLAAEVPGWPTDAKSPWFRAPAGYRTNSRLGAAPGVTAVSNADTGTAILRTVVVPDVLPPPLHNLYTPSEQTLASLPDGGRLVRLDGGPLRLYLASATLETDDGPVAVHALGLSGESAARALALALE